MRPLIVLTGQGVARADGVDLTRRLKTLPTFAELTANVARKDRQDLDVLLAACGESGAGPRDEIVRAMHAICLKERRTTQRKVTHRDLFAALAAVARQRLVLHVTTNVDGLTTTFAVRDFGACWPPFRAPSSTEEIVAALQEVLDADRGMIHVPVHGEAGLVVAQPGGEALQTYFGDARLLRGDTDWVPSLSVGLTAGLDGIEQRLLPARLGYGLFDALSRPGEDAGSGLTVTPRVAADLLVIGYGAEDRGTRATHPFEVRLGRLAATRAEHATRAEQGARATALVYRPAQNERSAAWFAARGFAVRGYDDGELPGTVRDVLEADPDDDDGCVSPHDACAGRLAGDPHGA